jgi:hypothetical protein
VDRLDRRVIRAVAARRFNHRRMAAEYEDLYCAKAPLAGGGNPRPITAA